MRRMAERRRDRRRLSRAKPLIAIAIGAWAIVLAAMVFEAEDPCGEPRAAPAGETALMPRGLSLAGLGTVTDVRRDEQNIVVKAVTTKPVDQTAVLVQDAVIAAGYRFAGGDSEGVLEAEVFFTAGPYAAGGAHVRQSPCAGRSDVELVLLDREAVPRTTRPTRTS